MNTPNEQDFDTIIEKFNTALSRMGPGMGDPVTRAERALLKTFYLFILQERTAQAVPVSSDEE